MNQEIETNEVTDEQEQSTISNLQSTIILEQAPVRRVGFMRDDIGWTSVGDWTCEFYAAYRARPGQCGFASTVLYRWRFTGRDRADILEQLRIRAAACGIETVSIVCVSRCEAILNVEKGALYGQAKSKSGV